MFFHVYVKLEPMGCEYVKDSFGEQLLDHIFKSVFFMEIMFLELKKTLTDASTSELKTQSEK